MSLFRKRKVDKDDYLESFPVSKLTDKNKYIFRVKNKKLIAIKYEDKISIFDNECPHRSLQLDDSRIANDLIICNHHNWKFGIESGKNIENSNCSLIKYRFKLYNENIWIKF